MASENVFLLIWVASFIRSLRVLTTPPIALLNVVLTELAHAAASTTVLVDAIDLRPVHVLTVGADRSRLWLVDRDVGFVLLSQGTCV